MTQAVLKNQVTKLPVSSGIDVSKREAISTRLRESLAETYRLMASTQILHWNVQGPLFYSMHNLTESQYKDFFEAIDDLAERIRALGMPAPKTISALYDLDSFKEQDSERTLETQISDLVTLNERSAAKMRDIIELAESAGDVKTADLLTERIGVLEQNAWMLRATIAEQAPA